MRLPFFNNSTLIWFLSQMWVNKINDPGMISNLYIFCLLRILKA